MQNLEYQMFIKEYGRILNMPNNFISISDNNGVLYLKANENHTILEINCTDEKINYNGYIQIIIDNNIGFIDYTQSFLEFGFPDYITGLSKYFDLNATIEICGDNKYQLTIGGSNVPGINFISNSSLDNYFKDIDLYMTDINLRRSNGASSLEKLTWFFTSLNYMQVVGKRKINQIKPYELNIYSMNIDEKTCQKLKEELSDIIVIVDCINFHDCHFEDNAFNDFQNLFMGAKFYKM